MTPSPIAQAIAITLETRAHQLWEQEKWDRRWMRATWTPARHNRRTELLALLAIRRTGRRLARETVEREDAVSAAKAYAELGYQHRPSRRAALMTLESRFWPKVDRRGPDECWPWLAHINNTGYGRIGIDHRAVANAHRVSYELARGPIPDGLQIDHLCRNRACVNPGHLEVVTRRENILRGTSLSAQRAQQTHCIRGHLFDEANTYRYGRGKRQRQCRACNYLRKRGLLAQAAYR